MKKILLHYYQYGTYRSPNNECDLIRENNMLRQQFEFVTLDQSVSAHEMGHLRMIQWMKRHIKAEHPDAIIIEGISSGFHCVLGAVFAGCKKRVLITHGIASKMPVAKWSQRMKYKWILEPISLMLATAVQCNSKESYNYEQVKRFAYNKRVQIYNFLDVPNRQTRKEAWREKHKINKDVFLIITIGNMHKGKGYDVLEEVIKRFNEEDNIKFVVIGDGPIRDEFENKLKREIASEKVICLGQTDHSVAMCILSESNLFLLPSRYETLGLVFAEAGYYGVPSIGCNVGGVPDIIENGKTGYLVTVNNAEEIVDRILLLKENDYIYTTMKRNAQEKISEMFSNHIIANQVSELLK